MENFGELIRQRLKELNMTQSKLAYKLGVSKSKISHYISGHNEVPFQNVAKICKILNLNLNKLYGIYDGSMNDDEMRMVELMRYLNEANRQELADYMNYLLYKQREKNDFHQNKK